MPNLANRTELTPLSFLSRSAFIFPHKTAVVDGERRWTYRQFAETVDRLATALLRGGLTRHQAVAFWATNSCELLAAHFAVPLAGGVLVAINTRLHPDEVAYILNDCNARFLFADESLYRLAGRGRHAARSVLLRSKPGSADGYAAFLKLAGSSVTPPDPTVADEDDPISINYTSGTTGEPKGVVYTHRGAYLNSLSEIIELGLTADSVFLWTLPMFHCNGWCCTWAITAVAATHVCIPRPDPQVVWQALQSEGVTHFNAAPTVHISLVHHPSARKLPRPVTVAVAGAPPSPTLLERMDELNFRPRHLYGLTETYGPMTVCHAQADWDDLPLEQRARLLARQGQAYVTADLIRVVDPQGHDVPRDGTTMGEVVMRGNNVMAGYFKQPDATDAAFRGGWFHSGDLAVWHADGYIELRDRKKDIIISGGENISTIEVEQTVNRHPAVLESAVIAIPDDKWGERPKAFVTLKPNESVSEQQLIDFCREQLAHFKCPAAVQFGPLPKTSTGKVQKYVLREAAWAGRDKRIN